MPGRSHVRYGQRPIVDARARHVPGGHFLGRRQLLGEICADELVKRARASLCLVAQGDRYLAANHARVGLPVAEAAHIGYRGARQRCGLRSVDLRIRRRGLATAWQ